MPMASSLVQLSPKKKKTTNQFVYKVIVLIFIYKTTFQQDAYLSYRDAKYI